MAINANNTVFFKVDPVDFALSQAGQSNKAGAFKTITTAYALTPDQTASIRRILNTFRPDTFMTGEPALKREIVAVLKNEILEAASQVPERPSISTNVETQIISRNREFVSFLNDHTSVFANDYPCQFEFGGEYYSNATDCFLSQHAEPMEQCDVMMHVLRAKFGQNPELKKQLLATGNAFLDCQGSALYLSDNFNGSGRKMLNFNVPGRQMLSICLISLRDEYCCTGIVEPGANYPSSIESLQTRCYSIADQLHLDFVDKIFFKCLFNCDYEGLSALACVNWNWNECSEAFWTRFDLKQFCPKGLTILDAQALGIPVDDEPRINSLEVLKQFKKLALHVENGGLTLLTMCKGTTLNELVETAAEPKKQGMYVDVGDVILTKIGNDPVVDTYVILITNNIFMESRNKRYDLQKSLVAGHGCEMPTVQEYVALCVFTNRCFKQCLYGRMTYGSSSTQGKGHTPLIVGCSTPARLNVLHYNFDHKFYGAGGRREF